MTRLAEIRALFLNKVRDASDPERGPTILDARTRWTAYNEAKALAAARALLGPEEGT